MKSSATKNKSPEPNFTTSNMNLSSLNFSSATDYKELIKTLNQFQKTQQLTLESNTKLTHSTPLKNKSAIDFNFLQKSGILNLKTEALDKEPGVEVNFDDIEKAFKILDEKNNGSKVSLAELKKKIPVINPNFPISEIPSLTNGKSEIKAKDLYEMLKQNELEDFDPLQEAFNLLDPQHSGQVDINRLRQIFQCLGYGEIDKKDVEILNECLDVDKDGKITINDLREIFDSFKKKN